MQQIVKLLVNNEVLLEYHRDVPLPDLQRRYLEDMDQRMDAGIFLDKHFIEKPDQKQKAEFVSLMLLKFIDEDRHNDASAMFTYLVNRLGELKQFKVMGEKGQYKFEWVFDKDHSDYQPIRFH